MPPVRSWLVACFLMFFAAGGLAHLVGADQKVPVPVRIELPGVSNAFQISKQIYSGSQPESASAFAALEALGVKTIVSVDGNKPDVEAARKHGIRYIHLPFGYDGVPLRRVIELAKVAATLPGPIFVHCHHGKHRGPAAVAIMCEATEGWTPAAAEAWMRLAGTSDDYPGLYRSAREFRPLTKVQLATAGTLPESEKTPDLVDAMVAIDDCFDTLATMQKSGWKRSINELTPHQKATLLWEHFRELTRSDDISKRSDAFLVKLGRGEKIADVLRSTLRPESADATAADAAFKEVAENCFECHKSHRNLLAP